MKNIVVLAAAMAILASCHKDNTNADNPPVSTHPEMLYTDLQDREVRFQQPIAIDLDKDGSNDIVFDTWFIGDPIEHEDELLFFAASNTHSFLLTDDANGSPIYKEGDTISITNHPGYAWYQVVQVEMALKNTGEQGSPYWEGAWKQVNHKYLAVQVSKNNKLYNGWIELSFDTAGEKIILHKAAISKEDARDIAAGKVR